MWENNSNKSDQKYETNYEEVEKKIKKKFKVFNNLIFKKKFCFCGKNNFWFEKILLQLKIIA